MKPEDVAEFERRSRLGGDQWLGPGNVEAGDVYRFHVSDWDKKKEESVMVPAWVHDDVVVAIENPLKELEGPFVRSVDILEKYGTWDDPKPSDRMFIHAIVTYFDGSTSQPVRINLKRCTFSMDGGYSKDNPLNLPLLATRLTAARQLPKKYGFENNIIRVDPGKMLPSAPNPDYEAAEPYQPPAEQIKTPRRGRRRNPAATSVTASKDPLKTDEEDEDAADSVVYVRRTDPDGTVYDIPATKDQCLMLLGVQHAVAPSEVTARDVMPLERQEEVMAGLSNAGFMEVFRAWQEQAVKPKTRLMKQCKDRVSKAIQLCQKAADEGKPWKFEGRPFTVDVARTTEDEYDVRQARTVSKNRAWYTTRFLDDDGGEEE